MLSYDAITDPFEVESIKKAAIYEYDRKHREFIDFPDSTMTDKERECFMRGMAYALDGMVSGLTCKMFDVREAWRNA